MSARKGRAEAGVDSVCAEGEDSLRQRGHRKGSVGGHRRTWAFTLWTMSSGRVLQQLSLLWSIHPPPPDPARLIPPPPLHRLPLPGRVGTHHRVVVAVRIGIVVLLVPLVVLLLLQSRGFCL